MVAKKDGTSRPCGDYRRLNERTTGDAYPIPHLHDLTSDLAGCHIFSKIDLVKGYHQVPVRAKDVPKTAIATPFGLFEFLRMPFGLKNAAQTFQRLMDNVTGQLPGVFAYIDDVLVASPSAEQHESDLRRLFDALKRFGLVVNSSKCVFGVRELEFLGHHVSARGIRPLAAKVDAVRRFERPRSIKSLQRFLGLVNFYRRFLPNIAATMRPLTDALSGAPRQLTWTDAMTSAFEATKNRLATAALLFHPIPNADLQINTDASTRAIAGAIHQIVDGRPQPLGFFSRRTTPAESRYSAYDLELLAIYSTIVKFRHVLEGRRFKIFTDQKPLTSAFFKARDPVSNRQRHQLAYISEFATDVAHVPGFENVVADALTTTVRRRERIGHRSRRHPHPLRRQFGRPRQRSAPYRRGTRLLASSKTGSFPRRRLFGCLRHVARATSHVGPRTSPPPHFRRHPQPRPSLRKDHPSHRRQDLRLERDASRRPPMGPPVRSLCGQQDHQARNTACPIDPGTLYTFHARPRRPRRPLLPGPRIQVPPHHGRPHHAVARGSPHRRRFRRNCASGVFRSLDLALWSPRHCHFRPRCPVHLRGMAPIAVALGHRGSHHLGVPSPGKRPRRALPLHAQERPPLRYPLKSLVDPGPYPG